MSRKMLTVSCVALLGLTACSSDTITDTSELTKIDAEAYGLSTDSVDDKMSEAEFVEGMWASVVAMTEQYTPDEQLEESLSYLEENKDMFVQESVCVAKEVYDNISPEAMEVMTTTDFSNANAQHMSPEDTTIIAEANEACGLLGESLVLGDSETETTEEE